MRAFYILAFFVAIGFFTSCSPDESPASNLCPTIEEADQTAMFELYKNDLIIPAYTQASADVQTLKTKIEGFFENPNSENLIDLQDQFKAAYISWEYAEPFYFGPAEDQIIEDHFNYFPVNLDSLQYSIENGFDSELTERYDRGFPAMDYLFFNGTETEIIDNLTSSQVSEFVLANIDNMVTRISAVTEAWNGSFGASFVSNTGKVDGASLSQIINTYNRHFETIKRNRIGLPSGILTLGFKSPDVVEGYYSGISTELAKAAVEASSNYFYGGSAGTDGQNSVYKLLKEIDLPDGSANLPDLMHDDIQEFTSLLNNMEESLDYLVVNEEQLVSELYQSLSSFVVLAKTDMPTALCISITYVDNPSDSD